jgi:hypothetical protein
MDATHTLAETAELILSRGAEWALTVKANQPKLRAPPEALPWRGVPVHVERSKGHARTETRTTRALVAPAWIEFPGGAQVLQIRRSWTTRDGKKHSEVCYVACSVDMADAVPPAPRSTGRPRERAGWGGRPAGETGSSGRPCRCAGAGLPLRRVRRNRRPRERAGLGGRPAGETGPSGRACRCAGAGLPPRAPC